METRVAVICDIYRQKEEIAAAGRILERGGVVAMPTETVYGLMANGFDENACKQLYALKNRPTDKPITELIADFADMEKVADNLTETAKILARKFMPGPVTLIVKKNSRVPNVITGGTDTVGVRMPDCPLTREIIRAAKVPLAAPSANLSGQPAPTNAKGVLRDFDGKIPLVIDGGATRFAVPSTVIDCSGEGFSVLRRGVVTEENIRMALDSFAPKENF